MKQKTYTITEAVQAVAESLINSDDKSETTIRCAINDHLDAMEKDGYKVDFDYNQPDAVASVQDMIIVKIGIRRRSP